MWKAICFAIEYDVKEFIPFLMIVFDWMNPIVETIVAPCDKPIVQIFKINKNMFGVEASMEESSHGTRYYKIIFISEVIYHTIYECW
jgi:hypothetical protein